MHGITFHVVCLELFIEVFGSVNRLNEDKSWRSEAARLNQILQSYQLAIFAARK